MMLAGSISMATLDLKMARQMQTSRAVVDRLLDPQNESATLMSLEKAALVLSKRLEVAFV